MKVVAQFEIPGDVVIVGDRVLALDKPAALVKTGPGQADHDLYLGGILVAEQAFVIRVDADRVYEAGKDEPTGVIVHKVEVGCVVDFHAIVEMYS